MTSAVEDLDATLDALPSGVRATFFVLGSLLERQPEIAERITARGHEIGVHAYRHEMHEDLSEFRSDLVSALRVFSSLGLKPKGYRHPYFNITEQKLDELARFFGYDASLVPSVHIPGHYGSLHSNPRPHVHRGMVELPLTVFPYLRLPAATGWYMRNLGYRYVETMLRSRYRSQGVAIVCLHTWEFTEKPGIPGVPRHVFRNAGQRMREMTRRLIQHFVNEGTDTTTCSEYVAKLLDGSGS